MSRFRDAEDHSSRIVFRRREQQEDAVVTVEGRDYVVYMPLRSIDVRVERALNLAVEHLRAYRAMTVEEWDALEGGALRVARGVETNA